MDHTIAHNQKSVVSKAQAPFFGIKKEAGFFAPACVQPKLTIGPANDPYEKEADAMAEQVMRMSDGQTLQTKPSPVNIQRKCAHCEEEEQQSVQMKSEPGIVQRDGNDHAKPDITPKPEEDNPAPGPLSIRLSIPGVNAADPDSNINFAEANIEMIELGVNNPADLTIPYTELWKTNYQLSTHWGLGNAVHHFYDARSKFDSKVLRPVRGALSHVPIAGPILKHVFKLDPKTVEGGDWDKFVSDNATLTGLKSGLARDYRPYNDESGFTFTINVLDFNFDENNLSGRYRNNAKQREHEKEEAGQRKAETTAAPDGMTAPASVHDAIKGSGQPMDPGTRSFMESRFGYDFSKVQVHDDAAAHQSSAAINALAYTNKNHVAFASGQYKPHTNAGRQLLAHELTHVVQQQAAKSPDQSIVNRAITYGTPSDTTHDPVDLVLDGSRNGYLALTTMTLNGGPANGGTIAAAFDASNLRFTANATTGNMDIDTSNVSLVIGADRILWTAPPRSGKWGGYYDRTRVPGAKTNCSGAQFYVGLKGLPNSTAFYQRVIKNEDEHVSDLARAGRVLEAYLTRMGGRTLPPCTGQTACEAAYNQQFIRQDHAIITQFVNTWTGLVNGHDDAATGRHGTTPQIVKNTCDKAEIEIKSKFP